MGLVITEQLCILQVLRRAIFPHILRDESIVQVRNRPGTLRQDAGEVHRAAGVGAQECVGGHQRPFFCMSEVSL